MRVPIEEKKMAMGESKKFYNPNFSIKITIYALTFQIIFKVQHFD